MPMYLFRSVFILISAYLIGSIPFGIIITRLLTGRDVRSQGSGHAGATNTMRVCRLVAGDLCHDS